MSTKPEEAPSQAEPKKSKKKLILIAGALVVLLGGGGGAYWAFAGGSEEPAKPEAHEEPEEEPGIVPLEAFIVNLADEGGSRFLRVTLSLVVANEEQALEFEENAVLHGRVRSGILELLALQTADHLITPEGKTALKKEIMTHAAHDAHDVKITDVLFSEFVVQ